MILGSFIVQILKMIQYMILILIFYCAKSLMGQQALVVGRFQDGWLHVIWKWNNGVCAWEYRIRVERVEKHRSVLGEGGRCGRGTGVVVCVVYWRYLTGAVVRLISCEGIQVVGDKCIR